jgi:hypothetical protein
MAIDSSRDDAASLLRKNNYRVSNAVVGDALKARRSSASHGTNHREDG